MSSSRAKGILRQSVLVALAACSSAAPDATEPGDLPQPDLPEPPEALWRDVGGARHQRLALLIVADRYQRDSWDIDAARRSGERMRRGLVEHCGFDESAVFTLDGDSVHRGAIESRIRGFATQAAARGPTLALVYFVGHGWVGTDGDPQFFTYSTREREVEGSLAGFDETISRGALLDMLRDAAAALGPDRSLLPVLVADACRVRVGAPPGRARIVAREAFEVYGVKDGRFAEVTTGDGGEASFVFTKQLVASIAAHARQGPPGSLPEVFEVARRATLDASGGRQEPELLGPKGSSMAVELVTVPTVGFQVRAVDALSRLPVRDARLVCAQSEQFAPDGEVWLEAPEAWQDLFVQAPGYLSYRTRLRLNRADRGRVMEIPLEPVLAVVQGRVEPPRAVRIRWTGEGPVRPDYHRVESSARADGSYELRPPSASGRIEVLDRDGRVVQGVRLGGTGRQIRRSPKSEALLSLVRQDIALERPDDHARLGRPIAEPSFDSAQRQADWANIQDAIAANRWDIARRKLGSFVRSDAVLDAWRDWVDRQWALWALGDGLRRGITAGEWALADEGLAWVAAHPYAGPEFDDLVVRIRGERVPLEVRRAVALADAAYNRGDLGEAVLHYRDALRAGANDEYRRRIGGNLAHAEAQLYDRFSRDATAKEIAGQYEAALEAYLLALGVEARAAADVRALLEGRPELRETELGRRAEERLLEFPLHGDRHRTGNGLDFVFVQPAEPGLLGFWIGTTEVSRAQWRQVMGADLPGWTGSARLPANQVAWSAAVEFCARAERADSQVPGGFGFRLPTVAEWTAALGASGADPAALQSAVRRAVLREVPAGHEPGLGLLDLVGNVAEWCADTMVWSSTEDRYVPHPGGSLRAALGGSFRSHLANDWVAAFPPETAGEHLGFRLVLGRLP
jgi:tetratricopeptide (TPR) repeat protein